MIPDGAKQCKTGGNNAKLGKTADTPADAEESKQHYTEIQTKKQVKKNLQSSSSWQFLASPQQLNASTLGHSVSD